MDWLITILITIASFIVVMFVWYVLDRIFKGKRTSKPLVPAWPDGSKLKAKAIEPDVVTLEWPPAESPLGAIVAYIIYQDDKKIATYRGKTLVYTTGKLNPGQKYTFKIEAKDEVDYISPTPLQTSIKLKETYPEWPAKATLKIAENGADLTISWPEATEDNGIKTYRILVDGNEVASVPAAIKSHTVHDLDSGDYVFTVEAQNNAGIWSQNGLELEYTYTKKDTEAPYWGKNAKLKITVSGKKVTIGWPAANDDTGVRQYTITIDNQPPTIIPVGTQTFSVNDLVVGKHTIEVKAFDEVGNASTPLSGEIVIQPEEDTQAPVWPKGATLQISAENKNTKIDWPAAIDDRGLKHYTVTIDNQAPAIIPAPNQTFSVSDLTVGKHTIEVTAYDHAGNASTPLSGEIIIQPEEDTTAPVWPKEAKLQISAENRNVKIGWPAATDNVAVKQYKIFLNNTAIATMASNVLSYTISGLVPGNNIFMVQAGDGANWGSGLSASFVYVEPDIMPPTWPAGAMLKATTKENKVSLEWPAAVDNVMVTLYKLWLDGAEIATLPGTAQRYEINDLAERDYVIELKAGDASDNFSEALSKKITIVYSSTMPFWPDGSAVTLKTNNDNSIIVSWPQAQAVAPSKITGYNLYQNDKLVTVLSSSTYSYTTDTLEDGKEYTFKIEAGDSKGKWTAKSITAFVKITPLVPYLLLHLLTLQLPHHSVQQ